MEKRILGIVPARGGSKSVPRKNIKLLAGEPLIAYTLREAKRSAYLQRVVVTTDDEEIAEVARAYGGEVPFMRPPELAGDEVTDLPVFQHCLRWLEEQEDYRPELVVHLRPTAPLRRVDQIDGAIVLLLKSPEADAVRSVCPAGEHPMKMWRIEVERLEPLISPSESGFPEPYNMPRQTLPKAYIQNGSVDVVRARVILEENSMTGRVILPYVMDPQDSVSIDNPIQFQLAELLMKERKSRAAMEVS